ncbi:MAG: hypothetical protein ACE5OP_08630 [Candidatus Glassbacteria bacterium]
MKRRILTSTFVIIYASFFLLALEHALVFGLIEPLAYVTTQQESTEKEPYNGVVVMRLFEEGIPDPDILPIAHPDIPYYIDHFPAYSYVVTTNFRIGERTVDSWAKVYPGTMHRHEVFMGLP